MSTTIRVSTARAHLPEPRQSLTRDLSTSHHQHRHLTTRPGRWWRIAVGAAGGGTQPLRRVLSAVVENCGPTGVFTDRRERTDGAGCDPSANKNRSQIVRRTAFARQETISDQAFSCGDGGI